MNISHLNTHILTNTAISALKNAYEECSDTTAKESILTAFKAIIRLHYNLEVDSNNDMPSENDGYDPTELCAAV